MRRLAVSVVLLGLAPWCAHSQDRKRVAVLNFEYATVQSSVSAVFGTNVDVGKGIADLLVTKLVNGGTYSVIERKAIDKIMAEQNFSNSDRADPNSAAKIGKILGVDAIIIGSITKFGRDDKSTGVGGSGIGGVASRYGLGGVGARSAKAVVGISARLVNTSTGEILAVAGGNGESSRSGATLLGGGGSSRGAGAGAIDMSSRNFADTIIGEAVGKAVDNVAVQLQQSASRLPTVVVTIDGLVADASGNNLVINVGSKNGLKVGDRLSVRRTGREIRDPATGKVIRRIEDKLGELVISEVDEQSAAGACNCTGEVKVGDRVVKQ